MTKPLAFLSIFLSVYLTTPGTSAAVEIDRNSVILKDVRVLKDAGGRPTASEFIYAGGIGGNSASSHNARPLSALRVMQP